MQERRCRRLQHDDQRAADRHRDPQRLRRRGGAARSDSPAPLARATTAVVPYVRKLKIVNAPERTRAGEPERRDLRPAQVADDRRIREHVQRLGGERAERRQRQTQDLSVVARG